MTGKRTGHGHCNEKTLSAFVGVVKALFRDWNGTDKADGKYELAIVRFLDILVLSLAPKWAGHQPFSQEE
jgi:hypothetical protein